MCSMSKNLVPMGFSSGSSITTLMQLGNRDKHVFERLNNKIVSV